MMTSRCHRETRQTARERKTEYQRSQNMAEEAVPTWAQDILEQVRSLQDSFQEKFDDLSNSIKELKKDMRAMLNRVSNAEKQIGVLEDRQVKQQESIKNLTKKVKTLKSKVTYLESHSRKNNLVQMGLEEGLLETVTLEKSWRRSFSTFWISVRLPEINRHHRSLRPRPSPTEPPRPYIIGMLKWSDRQLILGAASKKESLSWKGKPFHVFQDLPVEIQQQCAGYADIKRKKEMHI